jgi:surface protein
MQKTLSSLVLGLYLILTGCNTVDQLPELFLDSASIDNTFLTLKAEVLFTGGDKNTTRGFCWSTEPMPITDDNVVLDQNKGMGVFTASISGLIPQQRYYVRAFAENSFGKAYSNEIVIRTGYSNLLNAQLNSSGCLECDNYSIGDTFLFANEIYVVVGDYSLKAMVNSGKDVTKVCTSKVTSLWGLFKNKPSFNEDISSWDVSNVIDMREVFKGATNFNRDITNWDVSGVISMTEMFASATSFNREIGNWDVGLVEDFSYMFNSATSFNKEIGLWNTSSGTNMFGMFQNANKFNRDLGDWDVGNVTSMAGMFQNASLFNQDLTGWCVDNFSMLEPPNNFSTGSALVNSNLPIWGTCPP